MNGMKAKKLRRQYAAQFTEDGLPRDPNAWTVKDWADLWRAIQEVKRKVKARHGKRTN